MHPAAWTAAAAALDLDPNGAMWQLYIYETISQSASTPEIYRVPEVLKYSLNEVANIVSVIIGGERAKTKRIGR